MVELPGAVSRERLVRVVDDETGHLLDDHVAGVPVHRVLHARVVLVQYQLLQRVGAVRDHVARRRPVRAVRFDGRLVRGKERRVGRHRRKVGQGRVELHLQRVVVDRPHAQLRPRLVPGQDLLRVHHLGELEVPAVGRCRRGVDRALPGVDEIVRGHRVAVRPSGVLAQGEGVGGVAVGGGVAGRHPGNEVPLRVLVQEALEEIADDVESGGFLVELRIEGGELIQQAVGERLIVRQRLTGDRMGPGRMDERNRRQAEHHASRLHDGDERHSCIPLLHVSLLEMVLLRAESSLEKHAARAPLALERRFGRDAVLLALVLRVGMPLDAIVLARPTRSRTHHGIFPGVVLRPPVRQPADRPPGCRWRPARPACRAAPAVAAPRRAPSPPCVRGGSPDTRRGAG